MKDLDKMASLGLRTLAFGMKECPNIDLQALKDQEAGDFEHGLTLLGVTGVEDLLQDNAAKCVTEMREGGCQVWILTGDKDATAKEIGITCGVLSPDRNLVEIDDADEVLKQGRSWTVEEDVLISGIAIEKILVEGIKRGAKDPLIASLLATKGLIVYRASPSQKATLV